MTFDASKFEVGDGQYSDVVGVQAPVEKRFVGQDIQGITSALGAGYSAFTAADKAAKRAEAKEKAVGFSNRYDAELEKYSSLVSSGQMTKLQADTYLNDFKRQLVNEGASADELNQTEIAALKTISGKALLEGSAQEREEKKFEEMFMASEYSNPYHTPEQREEAKMRMFYDRNSAALRAQERDIATLKKLKLEVGSAEYKAAEEEETRIQIDALNNMLANSPTLVTNTQAKILSQYEEDRVRLGEAQARINAENSWNQFANTSIRSAQLASNQVKGGLPVQRDAYTGMIERRGKQFLENLGDTKLLATLEEIEKEDQARVRLAILNQPNVRDSVVVSDMYPGQQSLTFFHGLNEGAATSINNFSVDAANRNPGDRAPRFDRGKNTPAEARKALEASIKDFLDGNGGNPENLDKLVSAHLARLSEDFKELEGSEIDAALKYFSTPEFGKYIKQRGLSNEDIENVKRQLHDYKATAAHNFKAFIQDTLLETEDARKIASGRGPATVKKYMPKLLSKPQDFDLVFEGGIVAVKAKTERARNEAEEINDKISGPLSRIVKTDSNLSGKSHDQVFKAWKEQLWPEEFEEPLEDGMWKDPDTGEEFEVKDGKRVGK